jgi:4-hydroxy 2-oxovalerate aldolase
MATVLDCTFRDGGYKTGWRFDHKRVAEHIAGTAADVIEIGYRAAPDTAGEYRSCPDSLLEQAEIPDRVQLAVMVNAYEWYGELFRPALESRIDIVRVAAHIESINHATALVYRLQKLGYFVTLNIMQAHRADEVLDHAYPADVVYFADSFGCMSSRQVARTVERLKKNNREVGFHGHDNTGRGLSNTLTAMRHGATWLDASVNGIGRGAGNTDLIELLTALQRPAGSGHYDIDAGHTLRSKAVFFGGAVLKMHPKRVERWA